MTQHSTVENKCLILCVFSTEMEDTSQHVKLQVRVGDKIYEAPVSSNAVSEVLIKEGDHSEGAMAISQNNAPISEAMGVCDKNVEIMAVAPLPAAAAPAGNEVEVSV